jgi:hypothetical protein
VTSRFVTVNDKMQRGYRYELTAPVGDEFAPEFQPELTPAQMLQLGLRQIHDRYEGRVPC